jgi:hypothetical protein
MREPRGTDLDHEEPPRDRRACGHLTCTSRVIRAPPDEVYAAFLDRTALIDWLPPEEMTGEIYEFYTRVGGGYRMLLLYPADERAFRGKIVFARILAPHSNLLREGDELV